MTTNAKKGLLVTGPSQEDSALSGTSVAMVAQNQQRREAAEPVTVPPAEHIEHIPAEDAVQLWSEARSLYFAKDFPKYASKEWRQLHPDDPRRLAGALYAAEMWRKYGDEEELIRSLQEACAPRTPLWARRTKEELDELAKPKPPHIVTATPGWPPIRVPGTDTWRHNLDGRQVDLPHNTPRPIRYQEAA